MQGCLDLLGLWRQDAAALLAALRALALTRCAAGRHWLCCGLAGRLWANGGLLLLASEHPCGLLLLAGRA